MESELGNHAFRVSRGHQCGKGNCGRNGRLATPRRPTFRQLQVKWLWSAVAEPRWQPFHLQLGDSLAVTAVYATTSPALATRTRGFGLAPPMAERRDVASAPFPRGEKGG